MPELSNLEAFPDTPASGGDEMREKFHKRTILNLNAVWAFKIRGSVSGIKKNKEGTTLYAFILALMNFLLYI